MRCLEKKYLGDFLIILMIISLMACNQKSNGTKNENISESDSVAVNEMNINSFSVLPAPIDGCSSLFSKNEDDLKQQKYILATNLDSLAFMHINDKMVEFKLTQKTGDDSAGWKYLYQNETYQMNLETSEFQQVGDELWHETGKVILKDNKGNTIELDVIGESGC